MEIQIQEFITYLHNNKKTSDNTEISYERDLKKMMQYFAREFNITDARYITETNLNSYMLYLERSQLAASTVSRSIASLRAFFHYLYKMHLIEHDPTEVLHPPKVEKKLPEVLSIEEIDLLLKQPSEKTPKGIRDKAMLELLYATGIRVSELIQLDLADVNLRMGYIICHDEEKERIIPFGTPAKKALQRYIKDVRGSFLKNEDEQLLFTNCSGKAMSRQGFWKVLKSYAQAAGIKQGITPHTLRHSFAAHLVQNGADLKSVQEMMGHSDISTTQMYMTLNMRKMRDVYTNAHPRK